MRVMVIPPGALGAAAKDLIKRLEELEIKGRIKTIQTTALLRSATKIDLVSHPARTGKYG